MKTFAEIINETKMPDVKCSKCGIYMFKDGLLKGAYDTKDFKRHEKTGLCPMCKK